MTPVDGVRCPMCGASVDSNALKCHVCGERFHPVAVGPQAPPPGRIVLYSLSVALIVVAVIVFCGLAVIAVLAIVFLARGAIDPRQFFDAQ